ncbi:hypothetical protein GCM10010425_15260 [Streptomyces spororaveus]|uniref:Uncharacterized protein n=1 Tax=Streptomyces spororaveus TaxID=284039 RepID=A0ABQ3T689_9ACTN|nr:MULTISPECIES: hypothetical protein [Streptomyces]MCX5308816.1 hypothetical protein [Streptomyces sp. NBC_00160]GHI75677.1 hypothetical protein Sspor_12380 [Streptomyces spororaveus]
MARLNFAQLALAFALIHAVDEVRRDPAVVKAARQFIEDSLQAIRSSAAVAREAQSSWRRHRPPAQGAGAGTGE